MSSIETQSGLEGASLSTDSEASRVSRHRFRNGVKTEYGEPSSFNTPPGATRYGEPVPMKRQPTSCKAAATSSIAAVPVWAVIARHVHFGDPVCFHHLCKHLGRTTSANDERAFGGLPEVVKGRGQCGSTWAARSIKCRVDNKQWHHRTNRKCPLKSLMVADAQVSPEPQDDGGSAHTDSVDVSARSRMVEREIKPNLSHITQPSTITAP